MQARPILLHDNASADVLQNNRRTRPPASAPSFALQRWGKGSRKRGGHKDAGVEEGGSSAQVAVGRRVGGVTQGQLTRALGGGGGGGGGRNALTLKGLDRAANRFMQFSTVAEVQFWTFTGTYCWFCSTLSMDSLMIWLMSSPTKVACAHESTRQRPTPQDAQEPPAAQPRMPAARRALSRGGPRMGRYRTGVPPAPPAGARRGGVRRRGWAGARGAGRGAGLRGGGDAHLLGVRLRLALRAVLLHPRASERSPTPPRPPRTVSEAPQPKTL